MFEFVIVKHKEVKLMTFISLLGVAVEKMFLAVRSGPTKLIVKCYFSKFAQTNLEKIN